MSSGGISVGAPLGLEIPRIECRAINRSGGALAAGNVVMFDLAGTDAAVSATDNTVPGATDAGLSNVIAPTDNLAVGVSILAIALEAIADDATGRFCVQGRVTATTSEAVDCGDSLTVDNSSKGLSDTGGVNQGFFAFALEDTSGAGTGQVLFNGFGFGNQASSD